MTTFRLRRTTSAGAPKCACSHSSAAHSVTLAGGCCFCACKSFQEFLQNKSLPARRPLDSVVAAALKLLAHNRAFHELQPSELEEIGRYGRKRIIPAGTILIDEGDASDRVYLLLKGHASVEREQTDELPALLASLGSGDVIGEAALLRGTRHSATVRVLDDLLVLALTYRDIQSLFETNPAVHIAFVHLVHQRTEGPPPARRPALGVSGGSAVSLNASLPVPTAAAT